jgi:hypothetical protein
MPSGGGLEQEALEVLRLVVVQIKRREDVDSRLVERARAIIERYDRTVMRRDQTTKIIPLRIPDDRR